MTCACSALNGMRAKFAAAFQAVWQKLHLGRCEKIPRALAVPSTKGEVPMSLQRAMIGCLLGALAAASPLAVVSCSSPSETDGSSSSSSSSSSGGNQQDAGDPNVLAGTFQVRLVAPVPPADGNPGTPGLTAVLGKIYDGPSPASLIWEEDSKEGACRLLTPRVPFCNTPCGGSAVCVEDDTCQPYPTAHSAGTVTAKGIQTAAGASEFTMKPVANNYQPPADITLKYPGFAEGDIVRMEAAGEFYSAFAVESKGIAQLEVLNSTITLEPNKAVMLTWTAPGKAGISTIHVKVDVSHHGGSKGLIECDTEDTGSLELPAALVTKLLNLGIAGFPTVLITRQSVGSITIAPGRVDLVVSSDIEKAVDIPGLVSCTGTMDCPMGQTCQPDLSCK